MPEHARLPLESAQAACLHCHNPFTPKRIRPRGQRYCGQRCSNAQPALAERFWLQADRRGDDECWGWTGATANCGYGAISGNGRTMKAHRVSWELHYGPIPPGLCVCHKCDCPPCTNPRHLFIGTKAENTADMIAKGRNPRGERAGSAKLTEAKVIEIRALAAQGQSMRSLASAYGVGGVTVWDVVNRHRWRHVP